MLDTHTMYIGGVHLFHPRLLCDCNVVKILVLCPHFAPDTAPTGEVMTSIVAALADRGHELDIVTSLPWYTHHDVESEWKGKLWRTEKTSWGKITRLHPFPTNKTNIPARAVAFAGFTGCALIRAMISKRPDVVLVMSPPLPLGAAGWLAARFHRVPFVFNIQDVFPDVAVELGVITNERVIAVAAWLERFLYHRAESVTVLSADLADNVQTKVNKTLWRGKQLRRKRKTKVRIIPNFVDTERIQPRDRMNSYRDEFNLGSKNVVLYAGNIGMSQSLDLIIDTAKTYTDRDDVVFVINGGGSMLEHWKEQANDLPNVLFVPMQPRERLPEVLSAGDIHVIPLRTGLARSSVPSKLYSILASSRAVLASVDPNTEVDLTVRRAKAGVSVPPDDLVAFQAGLSELLDGDTDLAQLGESGRKFVEDWVSPAAVGAAYEELFAELTGKATQ